MVLPRLRRQELDQARRGSPASRPVCGTSSPRCSISATAFLLSLLVPTCSGSPGRGCAAVGCDEGLSPALWAWCGFSETTSLGALLCGAFLPPS